MKSGNKSAFTVFEMIIIVAILGLLAAIAIPVFFQEKRRVEEKKNTLEIGSNRELFAYSGYETGMVTRIFELPGTPLGTTFPVAEVAMTNDVGTTVLHGSFLQESQELKKGDTVLITTIKYYDIGGGKQVRFITKLKP